MEQRRMNYLLIGMATALGVMTIFTIAIGWGTLKNTFGALLNLDESKMLLIQTVVLTLTGFAIWWQLYQTRSKHHLDRLIAWKSSIQDINQLIIEHAQIFSPVLYPNEKQEKVERLTAAYASLHTLEVIYYMRKEDEYPPDRLKEFLVHYVSSEAFYDLWQFAQYRAAFTLEFQNQLNDILRARLRIPKQNKDGDKKETKNKDGQPSNEQNKDGDDGGKEDTQSADN